MLTSFRSFDRNKHGPWLVVVLVLALAVFLEWYMGRLWTCACNSLFPWAGDNWSSHNSQHLFDPYSVTHVLHGMIFCGILAWVLPRLSWNWRLSLTVLIEAVWEVVENSPIIIQRYREATFALGYEGDTILNSMGDVLSCVIGFWIAWRLGVRNSIILFVFLEILLLFWIKDNLTLNVIMLIHPIDAIKAWQMVH